MSALILIDARGRIIFASSYLYELLDIEYGSLFGKPFAQAFELDGGKFNPEPGKTITASFFSPLYAKPIKLLVEHVGNDVAYFYTARLFPEDPIENDLHCEIVNQLPELLTLYAKEKKLIKKLEHIATTDYLTQLPNRMSYMHYLNQAIPFAKEKKTKVGLLCIDVDNFKFINDMYGHFVGDKLLKAFGLAIKKRLRPDDYLARLGGDEFAVVILELNDFQKIKMLAGRFLEITKTPFCIEAHELYISLSIGIVVYPDHTTEVEEMVKFSDAAMYSAKHSGKSAYRVFNQTIQNKLERRELIASQFHNGLAHGEFYLVYQPQCQLEDSRCCGAEVMVRWNSALLGELMPSEFIPIAEENHFIQHLGKWILQEAMHDYFTLQSLFGSADFKLSINLSTLQLRDKSFLLMLSQSLQESNVPAKCLTFELTETVMMPRSAITMKQIAQIADLGVGLALDDFGTGYSSLSYLKALPVTTLKIDRQFTKDIVENKSSQAIISAIMSLADELSLRVIAEGIETKEQIAFLKKLGCLQGQGQFFGGALTLNELIEHNNIEEVC